MFKLQGSYAFPYDSSSRRTGSGCRATYTRRFSVGGLPQGTQTVFLQPRDGSLRMPSQNFIDMRFEERFRFGGTSRIR